MGAAAGQPYPPAQYQQGYGYGGKAGKVKKGKKNKANKPKKVKVKSSTTYYGQGPPQYY